MLIFLVGILTLGGAPAQAIVQPSGPPNILFIMLDDLGWLDLGAFGSPHIETPRIDGLAAGGTKLTQYYSGGAVCSPTRFSLMTSRNPVEQAFSGIVNGAVQGVATGAVEGAPNPNVAYMIDETLPLVLAEAGYRSYHVGKWHINGWNRYETNPMGRDGTGVGFDRSARMSFSPNGYITHVNPEIFVDDSIVPQASEGLSSDLAADWAIRFLELHAAEHPGSPFFLNLWLYAPHRPLDGASEYWLNYYGVGTCPINSPCADGLDLTQEERKYAAMVSYADEQIGRVIDSLGLLGLSDNTLIIVTSDNGGDLGQGIHPHGNGPLRGGKQQQYEGGIRVPFIASWPGMTFAGTENSSVVTSLDVLPTLASIAGVDVSDSRFAQWKGLDRSSVLFDPGYVPRDDTLIWTGLLNNQDAAAFGMEHRFAVREGDLKLVMDAKYMQVPKVELFDLSVDPYEQSDLFLTRIEDRDRLWQAYWDQRKAFAAIDYEFDAPSGMGVFVLNDSSFRFSGNGGLELSYLSSFDYAARNEFSLAFQFQASGTGVETLLEKPGNWRIFLDSDRALRLHLKGKDGKQELVELIDFVADGTLYEVGVSFIRQQFKDFLEVRWYIDGTIDSSRIIDTLPHLDETSGALSPIYVGMDGGAGTPFKGLIRDLRLYTLSLTGQELSGSYPPIPGIL